MDNSNILILRPNKLKMILHLLLCLAGTIVGYYMTKDALINEKLDLLISIFVFVTSGIGLLVAFVLNLPNSSYLKLTSYGFEVCTLYKKYSIKNQKTFGVQTSFHDTFNKKPEELAQLLNEWKTKYGN